jgi:hypothetical protein
MLYGSSDKEMMPTINQTRKTIPFLCILPLDSFQHEFFPKGENYTMLAREKANREKKEEKARGIRLIGKCDG